MKSTGPCYSPVGDIKVKANNGKVAVFTVFHIFFVEQFLIIHAYFPLFVIGTSYQGFSNPQSN
jgi:hypothetical protein